MTPESIAALAATLLARGVWLTSAILSSDGAVLECVWAPVPTDPAAPPVVPAAVHGHRSIIAWSMRAVTRPRYDYNQDGEPRSKRAPKRLTAAVRGAIVDTLASYVADSWVEVDRLTREAAANAA